MGAGVEDGRPFRLGFLLHLDRDVPPAQAYREAIETFVAAEELGYDSGWVIQRHFRQGLEHVSAPLAAARGDRPAHLADPAGHRGAGAAVGGPDQGRRGRRHARSSSAAADSSSASVPVRSPPPGRRSERTSRTATAGTTNRWLGCTDYSTATPLNRAGEVLHPPGHGVRERLWQATTSDPERARAAAEAAARAGDGLQLSRATAWRDRTVRDAQDAQAEWIASYREVFASTWAGTPRAPRVQASRAVYPHPDSAAATRLVTPGVRRWQSWTTAGGDRKDTSVEQYLADDHALLGPPELLAAELATDPALADITDLLVSFVPGVPEPAEHVRLLRSTAQDVAGELGWTPAAAPGRAPAIRQPVRREEQRDNGREETKR